MWNSDIVHGMKSLTMLWILKLPFSLNSSRVLLLICQIELIKNFVHFKKSVPQSLHQSYKSKGTILLLESSSVIWVSHLFSVKWLHWLPIGIARGTEMGMMSIWKDEWSAIWLLYDFWQDVQSKVSAVVLGKEKPVEESNPEYEKLKHYIFELEDHLAEAQKHAYRLVKRHRGI